MYRYRPHVDTRMNAWLMMGSAIQGESSESNQEDPGDLSILRKRAALVTLVLQAGSNLRTCFCLGFLKFGFQQDGTCKATNALETFQYHFFLSQHLNLD